MEDLTREILALPPDATLQARIVTVVSPLTVDVNGTPRTVNNSLGGAAVRLGDAVLIATAGGVSRALVNLTPLPTIGTVTAVGATTVTVSAGGVSTPLAWSGTKPAVGNTVGIVWSASGSYVAGVLSQATPTLPGGTVPTSTSDPVPVAPKAYTITANAVTVCSSDAGGSWTNWGSYGSTAVQGTYSGTNYKTGWFFYGSAFGGPAGRVCTGVRIVLKRGSSGLGSSTPEPAHIFLHGGVTKGSAPPALIGGEAYTTPGFLFDEVKSVPLPVAIGQAFLDGTAAGIALSYSGTADYAQWLGIASFSAAGQLSIDVKES